MKKKALWKDTFREIPKSFMRFLAIMIIIFLGVGFYVGLSATSPNMIQTADKYFKEYNLMDFRVQSTYGLTKEDVMELNQIPGVSVQGQYAYDFYIKDYNQTIRLFSYDSKNDQDINQFHIAEGRLPTAAGEIALDRKESFLDGIKLGDTIKLETGDRNGNPEKHLTTQQFKVVGFVDSPLYITHGSRGFTTIGSGSVSGFGVISHDDYDTDFFSEANLLVENSQRHEVFSTEYEAHINPYEEEIDALLTRLEKKRAKTIQEDAQNEINDGWAELEEGEQELAEAEQDLADARAEIDEGWAEYEEGLVEFEDQIAAANEEIDRNEQELNQTITDLEAQRQDLMTQQAELQEQLSDLDNAEVELISGRTQLEQGLEQVNTGIAEFEANRPTIEASLQKLENQEASLRSSRTQLTQAQAGLTQLDTQIDQAQAQRSDLENQLENAPDEEVTAIMEQIASNEATQEALQAQREATLQQLTANGIDTTNIAGTIAEIDAGLFTIEENRQTLNEMLKQGQQAILQRVQLENQLIELETQAEQLQAGRTQLQDGIKQITDGLNQLEDGLTQANEGYAEIEKARVTLAEESEVAEIELANALTQLNKAEEEYTDGLATFEEERADALKEIAEGRADLEQAERDLADLPLPEYFATRRSEDSTYIDYKDNTDRLAIIAAVFPVFFFLIAIFISFTTMTRMVDEEREYVGIMKALGYDNQQILTKFITYSVLATGLGVILGLVVGYTFIPNLIFYAYGSMYHLPAIHLQQYTLYSIIAFFAAFGSTVGASMLAVKSSLRSNAASLLQPKAPKSGTRIWLERFPLIWNKLNFNYKITFRNVFRYKSRMFMTIFGIAGSMGLILTGFGISDSISTIPDTQYTELNHFQAYVALDSTASQDEIQQYVKAALANEQIDHSLLTLQESVTIEREDVNTQDATVFVPESSSRLDDFISLNDYQSDQVYTLDDSGAYITQKLATLFDFEIGDEMPVSNDRDYVVTIAGIVENYVGHTIYMSPAYYKEVTGNSEVQPNLQLIKFDPMVVDQDELGTSLLKEDVVVGVTYSTDVYDAFSDTLNSLDLITQILVIAAAALAFIVLYNLTNINVSERERELSTIKVLGFHDFEVTMYIYRENIILTFLGIFFGSLFGTVLQRFIMTTMEVDNLVFGKVIDPSSYIYSTLLTLLFTIIVMIVIHFQLKRINMVEALKAND